jgi:hypothetical protein
LSGILVPFIKNDTKHMALFKVVEL